MDVLYSYGIDQSKTKKIQSPPKLYDKKLCPYFVGIDIKSLEICYNKHYGPAANGCVQGGGMAGLGGEFAFCRIYNKKVCTYEAKKNLS